MKKKGIIYVYIVIMVFALVILGLSVGAEYFRFKLIPLIVSGFVLILSAIGLRREILARDKSGTTATRDETDDGKETRESWYRYSLIGAWVVGFLLAIYLLGFITAIPLFLLSYLKTHGAKWRIAITIAVLTTAIIYGVFILGLKVYLYEGLLFRWLGY